MPTSFETINGTPDYTYAVARCGRLNEPGSHGVVWKPKAGVNLKKVKCPVHDKPLIQTTRSWQIGSWTVIPQKTVDAINKEHREAQKAAKADALAGGTHTLVRDLQPGQVFIFEKRFKNSEIASGKLVEIEKLAGGKYRLVVSRTYEEVVSKYDHWRANRLEAGTVEWAEKLEELTVSGEVPGSLSVVTDIEWAAKQNRYGVSWTAKRWTEGHTQDAGRSEDGTRRLKHVPFTGWAVDQPQCQLELWYARRDDLELRINTQHEELTKLPLRGGRLETEERYAERVQAEKNRKNNYIALLQKQLDQAYARIELHTNHGRP